MQTEIRTGTTTEFFREISSYYTILDRLAPNVGNEVKIASLGCSSGDEVYSLLMLHKASNRDYQLLIDGYDYSERQLEIARAGVYDWMHFIGLRKVGRDVLNDLLGQDVKRLSNRGYEMGDRLKGRARFMLHDVTKQPLPEKYRIILCANMLYHYADFQGRTPLNFILNNIAQSLEPGGFLVCEDTASDNVPRYKLILESHHAFRVRNELAIEVESEFFHRPEVARVLQLVS